MHRLHRFHRAGPSGLVAITLLVLLTVGVQSADASDKHRRNHHHRGQRTVHVQASCRPAPHYSSRFRTVSRPVYASRHVVIVRSRDEHRHQPAGVYWSGYRMGQRAGYDAGYNDGRRGKPLCADVCGIPSGCSAEQRRGFIAGYQAAYRDGYKRGISARYDSCRPRHRHRRH